jgi:hypothetical protein
MIDFIPNLTNLKLSHLIDPSPAGEKIIAIDFSNLDFEDSSGVPISFRACKTHEDLCDWYGERCDAFPSDLVPYLSYKTMGKSIPTKSGFFKKKGNFTLAFE